MLLLFEMSTMPNAYTQGSIFPTAHDTYLSISDNIIRLIGILGAPYFPKTVF